MSDDVLSRLGDSLSELRKFDRDGDLSVYQRDVVKKASRQAQLSYLQSVSPAAAAAWSNARQPGAADTDDYGIHGSEADLARFSTSSQEDMIEKAARIRRQNPGMSEFQSLKAARQG